MVERCGPLFDPDPDLAVLHARAQAVARRGVEHAAHHPAVVVLDDGVAARDRRQRAHRLQRARQPAQAQRVAVQAPGQRRARARRQRGQALAQARDAPLRMVRAQHRVAVAQARGLAFDAQAPGLFEPAQRVLLAAAQRRQARLRAQCVQAQAGAVGALHRLAQALALQVPQARVQHAQAVQQVLALRHQQLGGHRRRGRAHVGGEVGQAEVGLVADGRNHRHLRRGDGARQPLVVERPQVFQRAAAAGEDDHVVTLRGLGALQHRHDLLGRAVALHRHRQHLGLGQRETPAEHAEHVAHRRAAGRGDDRDAFGKAR